MQKPVNPKASTDSTYVLNSESELELARLLIHDQLLTQEIGGIWPEQTDVTSLQFVLDIACGPGGWALDVAQRYPSIDVTGIDISYSMIHYAQAQAQVRGLDNVSFSTADITQPFDIPDQSFDLVNARFLVGVLRQEQWMPFLQECWRILRPEGILRITEPELPITNSVACDSMNLLVTQAMKQAGYGFSPRGHQFGIQMELEPLLRQAGYQQIGLHASATNASSGTHAQEPNAQNHSIIYHEVLPFLQKYMPDQSAEISAIYEQACDDLRSEHFHSIQMYLTAWGQKLL